MAELFKIDIEFNPFAEKPIIVVPEEISIPLNSQILWRIKKIDHSVFREMKFNKGVSFSIYFDDNKTPFKWRGKKRRLRNKTFSKSFYIKNNMALAMGTANKIGDFKYSVSVTQIDGDFTYDDDPYIHIY